MYLSINRIWPRISMSLRGLLWLSLGMALVMSSRMAVGQEGLPPAQTQLGDSLQDGWLFSDQFTGQSGEAFGMLFRGGVQTGPAIGRQQSIVPLELMPYAFIGKGMIFGDVRGFRGTTDFWGVNLGGGFRYHSDQFDRIFGGYAYWDYDNISGTTFQQTSFGVETLGALWDLRANFYFPTGETAREISRNFVSGSERFVDHRILYDQRRVIGNALTGGDMELMLPIPGRVMERHAVRAGGGWYRYEGDSIEAFTGWKTSIQANVLPSVEMQLQVTNDSQFDTNVVFGATWTYGGFRQPETERRSQFSRMTDPVRRNYNMIVANTIVIDDDLVAINPNTGQPYFVEHVASYAPAGGDGTVENPWQTIAEAQNDPNFAPYIAQAGGDIIFVHANSVYDSINFPADNSVTLTPSIRILGEGSGVEHRIAVTSLGVIPVPRATTFVNRPTFLNSPGDAVTLVSGSTAVASEFSGFVIGSSDPLLGPTSGPVGNGIVGNGLPGGLANVVVTQTDINFAGGDGILMSNVTGPVTFRGVRINDPTGVGLHVTGGTGGITFGDDFVSGDQGEIVNSGDYALLIENTLNGSFVNLTDSTITDTAGNGILIDNVAGTVTVDETTINDGLITGIEVRSSTGSINFRGPINIDNPTNDAIFIHDMLGASTTSFTQNAIVNITDRNARGIYLLSNAGLVQFGGAVSIADTAGSPDAALEYQDSSGNASFQNITINGGGGDGIVIGGTAPLLDNSGRFNATGVTTISNVAGNGILITDDDADVSFFTTSILSRGLSGINVNNSRGTVSFRGQTTVGNTGGSTSAAVDIQNNTTADVSFETLTITDATRPLPLPGGAGLNVENNLPTVTVNRLNVTTVDGIALFVDNAGDSVAVPPTGGVFIGTGILDSVGTGNLTGRPAVDVQNSVIQIGLQSVSSSNSTTQGIILVNNTGGAGSTLFSVSGTSNILGSGGTITGANADAVLFQNTGVVGLANMILISNTGSGVQSETDALALAFNQIRQNGLFGVNMLDTPVAVLLGNTIDGNLQNEVVYTAATTGAYSLTLGSLTFGEGNTITDTTDDPVLIQTQGVGSTGSSLALSMINNAVTTTTIGSNAVNLNWNGAVTGGINANTFNFGADNATGLLVNLGSATLSSNLDILSNTFNSPTGIGTTGIDLTTNGGPSSIRIGQLNGLANGNVMNFNSAAGAFTGVVGMRFNLGSNTDMNIFSNSITMLADGGAGMEFTLVQGTSNLTIENNLIDITSNIPVLLESGIEILGVTGTVNLQGNVSNTIILRGLQDVVPPWFSAPAAINGQIVINGVTLFP